MKLEEVLPALRAGKRVRIKCWPTDYWLGLRLGDYSEAEATKNEILSDEWEIVGEECYQDGLKLPTEEDKKLRDNFVDFKLDELFIKMTVIHGHLIDVDHYTKNQIERIDHILEIYNERLCDLDMKIKNISENKTSEKCPACNGLSFRTIFRDYPPGYSENIPCVPCDGKGVIWK